MQLNRTKACAGSQSRNICRSTAFTHPKRATLVDSFTTTIHHTNTQTRTTTYTHLCSPPQVSRLEQRIHAVTADNDALQSELDSSRQDIERARDAAAAASAGEGLARLPRDSWPLPVLMLVQAAEATAISDIAEKHVSVVGCCCCRREVGGGAAAGSCGGGVCTALFCLFTPAWANLLKVARRDRTMWGRTQGCSDLCICLFACLHLPQCACS